MFYKKKVVEDFFLFFGTLLSFFDNLRFLKQKDFVDLCVQMFERGVIHHVVIHALEGGDSLFSDVCVCHCVPPAGTMGTRDAHYDAAEGLDDVYLVLEAQIGDHDVTR